ncbi:glycoside hydrolase family 28 protein [Flavobacterium sp. GSA192]|uniref:glycoside hydrolase family 28 protein n=1 Tax=Flavobacterium sp. GSA192 TaxID=2576304 RepID=UPI00112B587E|nr:glycoside hydrolase family 28 protein [Flavobacterium sp. GSA192]
MKLKNSFKNVILFSCCLFVFMAYSQNKQSKFWSSSKEALKEMEQIRKLIKAPKFKNTEYLITDFGAKGDGVTKNTEAFKKAIETCNKAGGGKVVIPVGNFLTGPIYLKSNVNLVVSEGATITFSKDTKDYPIVLTRWEGMDCMNYSPQIYAYNEKNIAITGSGTINGNADKNNWWPWKGRASYGWKKGDPNQFIARDSLHVLMKEKIDPRKRIFGDGHYLRPYMIQPYNCKNFLMSGVKLIDSPMWFASPVMCENVIFEKVQFISHGPNTDGCDPDACKNVLIKDCYFDTGDDCIAIKSGRDEDGRGNKKPAENHIIEGCTMKDGHGGIVIGSEIAGGAKNIFAVNCKMDSKNLDRVLRVKTSSSRGGTIENIFLKDIIVGSYGESAIHFNMFYENPGDFMPTIRNIWVENLNVEKGGDYAIWVNAYKDSPIENLKVVNCKFNGIKTPLKIDHVKSMQLENVVINGELFKYDNNSKK